MTRLAVIGEALIELAPLGAGTYLRGVSGDTWNTACTIAGLGHPVTYATALGQGNAADSIRNHASNYGLELLEPDSASDRQPGLYMISNDASGERFFEYWRSQSAARAMLQDAGMVSRLLEQLSDAGFLYLSGITLAIMSEESKQSLVSFLREYGGTFVFDPNYRPTLWESAEAAAGAFKALMPYVDIYLPGFEEEASLFGHKSVHAFSDFARSLPASETIIKNGADSCFCITGDEVHEISLDPVKQMLDATGAGDTFNGGYIAARLSGAGPVDAVKFGARCAREIIQIRGGCLPVETLETLKD